jgi:hypothetical protein
MHDSRMRLCPAYTLDAFRWTIETGISIHTERGARPERSEP